MNNKLRNAKLESIRLYAELVKFEQLVKRGGYDTWLKSVATNLKTMGETIQSALCQTCDDYAKMDYIICQAADEQTDMLLQLNVNECGEKVFNSATCSIPQALINFTKSWDEFMQQ